MKNRSRARVRRGYLAAAAVLALGLAAALNLLVSRVPASAREVDLTDNGLYNISDTSREFLAELEQDVEIAVLAEEGEMDERILKFLELYQELSQHITVTQIDPAASPAAAAQYNAQAGSLVVSCQETGRSRTLSASDLIVSSVDYTYWYPYEISFDAEGQLTSAVNYVTSDTTQTVYTLSGHGEGELPEAVSGDLAKANLTVFELNLLMEGAVPGDASLVLIYAPAADLTADEAGLLEEYIAGGGHVLLLLGEEMGQENLESLLARVGLSLADGYIADSERCYAYYGQYYLSPELNPASALAGDLTEQTQFMLINARGMMQQDPLPGDAEVEPVLTTSRSAQAVTQNGQVQGEYLLGAVATVGEEAGTLTVFSSASLIDEGVLTYYPNMGNETLFCSAVTAHMDQTETFSIPAKSLTETFHTVSGAGVLSLIFVVLLPAGVLIAGLTVCLRRRRRG